MSPRRGTLWQVGIAFVAVTAARGQTPVFEPPPTATTRSVAVAEGGRIDIRLGTIGSPAGKTLDIQIRLRPTKGRLEPVQVSVAGDGGTVGYTHVPPFGAGYDSFTYTVQRAGGPVSPPATVTVRIPESPAQLAVGMAHLDFGAVNPGDVGVRQSLVVINLGGSVAGGWVSPPPPWRIEGSQSYRLRRGERQSFTLVLRPAAAGRFIGELRFGAGANQTVLLSGIGRVSTPPDPAGAPALWPPNPGWQNVRPGPSPTAAESLPADAEPGVDEWAGGPATVTEWFPHAPGGEWPIAGVEALAADDANILLRWPVPSPRPAAYRVETRMTVATAQRLEVSWVPGPASVESQSDEAAILARIGSLAGGRTHCLRVVALNDAGQMCGYSAGIDLVVRTAPFAWAKGLAAVVVCALPVFAIAAPRRRPFFPEGNG